MALNRHNHGAWRISYASIRTHLCCQNLLTSKTQLFPLSDTSCTNPHSNFCFIWASSCSFPCFLSCCTAQGWRVTDYIQGDVIRLQRISYYNQNTLEQLPFIWPVITPSPPPVPVTWPFPRPPPHLFSLDPHQPLPSLHSPVSPVYFLSVLTVPCVFCLYKCGAGLFVLKFM